MPAERITTDTPEAFVATAVDLLERRIRAAVDAHGTCVIGLSGGSTPGPVYEQLGRTETIDWSAVHLFLVDERHVPPGHQDSNQRLARDTLLRHAAVPDDHFVFPDTALPPRECAADYERRLSLLFATHPADIAILGMGPDGHIASLFPPLPDAALGPALAMSAQSPLDAGGQPRFPVRDRISVTLPVLHDVQWSLMLLQGTEKVRVWNELETSGEGVSRWPAKALLEQDMTVLLQE